jgi:MSHA biogenesis protein MshN
MMPEALTEPTEQVTSRAQMSVSQSSTFEQAQHLYQQYIQARSNGQFALAETSLRLLQLIDPQQALPLLAELYWQQQQGAQLDAVLLAAQNANVSDSQLVRFQLLRLQQQQRWSELIPQLTETRMAELGVEFIAMKAQALWQTAQYAQALPIYQRWTTEAPTDARAWLGQALVLEKLQQPSAAKKAYQQAMTYGGLSVASLQFIQQRLAALKE